MIITVVFSTHNGAGTLPAMLAKLQIVAVDNNSSDATGDILRTASADLPLTAIRHGERGKNRPLNAALPTRSGASTRDSPAPLR